MKKFTLTLLLSALSLFFAAEAKADTYNPLLRALKMKRAEAPVLIAEDEIYSPLARSVKTRHTDHCKNKSTYTPPKGVYKMFTRKVRKCQVQRQACLPCGRKTSYCETVVIYRDHFSDGSTRTWTCVKDCAPTAMPVK